jgi:hypothetical protein
MLGATPVALGASAEVKVGVPFEAVVEVLRADARFARFGREDRCGMRAQRGTAWLWQSSHRGRPGRQRELAYDAYLAQWQVRALAGFRDLLQETRYALAVVSVGQAG